MSDIDGAINACKQHLADTSSGGSEIETFLTRFLLIHAGSEYDKEIKSMIVARASKSADAELVSFVRETADRSRNQKISDIRGLLKKFSQKYLDAFDQILSLNPESQHRYQNIIVNRNASAHGGPINMTMRELDRSHQRAKYVLNAISEALDL